MEKIRNIKTKVIVVLTILATIFTISVNSYAAKIYTSELAKEDELEFTGTSWNVYKSKSLAKKVGNGEHPTTKRYMKNGEKFKILAIDKNVLKIAKNEYIYYGSTAKKYFKKADKQEEKEDENKEEENKEEENKVEENKVEENKVEENKVEENKVEENKVEENKEEKKIAINKIKLDKTDLSLYVNKDATIKATIEPSNATKKDIEWKSSDKSVATVNKDGKVTAKKAGTATITATAKDGSGKNDTCKVTVKNVDVTGISLNKKEITLKVGKTETLKATIKPSNATNKNVTWSSNKTSVATVNKDGKVTSKGKGTATITAKAGGKTATCKVTVPCNHPKNKITTTIVKQQKEKDFNSKGHTVKEYCNLCKKTIKTYTVNHKLENKVTKATCCKDGIKKSVCKCGYYKVTETISKTGKHKISTSTYQIKDVPVVVWGILGKKPNEKYYHVNVKKCENSGNIIGVEGVVAHEWIKQYVPSPSCTKSVTYYKECKYCHYKEKETIAKIDHKFNKLANCRYTYQCGWIKEMTCSECGLCSYCGKVHKN